MLFFRTTLRKVFGKHVIVTSEIRTKPTIKTDKQLQEEVIEALNSRLCHLKSQMMKVEMTRVETSQLELQLPPGPQNITAAPAP
jgi:hypothetical protein